MDEEDEVKQQEEEKENRDKRTMKLCEWLINEGIDFEISQKFYGEGVANTIKIKEIELEIKGEDEKKLPLYFVIQNKELATQIFAGEWEDE